MLSEELVGRQIVLRYHRGEPAGRPPLSDLVGELIELSAEAATVRTRSGQLRTVPLSNVLIAKPVGASRREILQLARIGRLGWRAAHRTELDGWLLSADHGWTGRANSVLPLRMPDRPLDELLAAARAFYAEHGLPLQLQLPLPARAQLDGVLASRGWPRGRPAVVLTRRLAGPSGGAAPLAGPATEEPPVGPATEEPPVGPATADRPPVELAGAPDDDWLAGYHYRGGPLPEHARQLLLRHDLVTFASIRLGGRTVAIARGCVDAGWLGITSVEVAPDCRRHGLATALVTRLAGWAAARGAVHCYLQVDENNQPALALYARLGFIEHHRYHYRAEPAEAVPAGGG
ncbi:MAG TPA: GNAT family N-acetyltransferase [Jatrophihabitans sp.]|nr:GNAT family N-acetyltransferase [Jatrophihabitans sp.]